MDLPNLEQVFKRSRQRDVDRVASDLFGAMKLVSVGPSTPAAVNEREQWQLLRRIFFARFLENDLLSRDVPQVQLVIWSLAVSSSRRPLSAEGREQIRGHVLPQLPEPRALEQAAWTDKLLSWSLR